MKIPTFSAAVFAVLLNFAPVMAQQQGLPTPNRNEARQILEEIVDRMEAAAIVVPELARAGAPLTENVRQAVITLETGREHVGVLYRLLTNAKIFLQLVDALPKASGYDEEMRRQLERLRLDVDRVELYFLSLLDRREEQVLGADRDNLRRYAEENSRLGPPHPDENRVVFLGDSITDGWKLNQYFPSKPYINRGISGQITGQMLGRMQADVIALQPKAMVFLGGTNDLARGVSLDAVRYNMLSIMELAEVHGILPIMASILPVSDYHAEKDPRYRRTRERPLRDIVALNRWLRQTCEAREIPYLDYYSAMVDDQGMLRAELADDGLHPNTEGYKIMARLAAEKIDEALEIIEKPSRKRKKRFGVF